MQDIEQQKPTPPEPLSEEARVGLEQMARQLHFSSLSEEEIRSGRSGQGQRPPHKVPEVLPEGYFPAYDN